MFDIRKFGGFLSRLRKNADMTQSALADKLNLTRQAVSKYELGESFPDISILVEIAKVFNISIDELINSGEPTKGEADILEKVVGNENDALAGNILDIVNLAPLLKPSVLDKLAEGLMRQGIDITNIVKLAEFMNDKSVIKLLENAKYDDINTELIEKLIPFLDEQAKGAVFEKIIDGELDWHLIITLYPYFDYMTSQIEEAIVEGAVPEEVLKMMRENNKDIILKGKRYGY